jgi:hypothetical protein
MSLSTHSPAAAAIALGPASALEPVLACLYTPAFTCCACSRVLRKWVSRFDLWPYLERFTIDATKDILAEVGGWGAGGVLR